MATHKELGEWVGEARQRTCELIADLSDAQLMGPRLAIVNPLLWEIGHVAWFQEKWALRHAAGQPRASKNPLSLSRSCSESTSWKTSATRRYDSTSGGTTPASGIRPDSGNTAAEAALRALTS